MKQRWFFILLINAAFIMQMSGQISMPSKGKKTNAQQKEQLQIDEQLASQYYRDQDYENARDLYGKLYEKSGQIGHFQQYIECLLQLKDYDKAEKELKSFAKKQPNYYKANTDLVYVYTMQGKTDKAKKLSNEILNGLTDNASSIRNLSYGFLSRGLNDMALAVLEKGNKLLDGKETFYMEQANVCRQSANYQEAFRYYFLELEVHPGQYNNIRITNSIISIIILPLLGFVHGTQPIIGYNYGARLNSRVKETLKFAFIYAGGFMFITWAVLMWQAETFVAPFAPNDPELIKLSAWAMRIFAAAFFMIPFGMVSGNFFQGTGKAFRAMFLNACRQVILLIPFLLILPHFFELKGVFMAQPIADTGAAIIGLAMLWHELKKLK